MAKGGLMKSKIQDPQVTQKLPKKTRANATVGFRPSPDAKKYIEAVMALRPALEKSDVVSGALMVASQHATPSQLVTIMDTAARQAAVARLELELAAARAALADCEHATNAPESVASRPGAAASINASEAGGLSGSTSAIPSVASDTTIIASDTTKPSKDATVNPAKLDQQN